MPPPTSFGSRHYPPSVRAPLDREALSQRLEAEDVEPRAVDLDGGRADEAYVLEPQAVGWAVYYAERGLRREERLFASEHDACAYLLDIVLKDPTTRRSRWP